MLVLWGLGRPRARSEGGVSPCHGHFEGASHQEVDFKPPVSPRSRHEPFCLRRFTKLTDFSLLSYMGGKLHAGVTGFFKTTLR